MALLEIAMVCGKRRRETERLALLRAELLRICGCTRCGDADRGAELTYLIAKSQLVIAELTDRICDEA